ncbi:MAG: AAA family ATPase [Gammaproteobacteria bacterium]|nr:AAA family ATPase [Gammaproteobacteria bacterium]MCW8923644.1 AAA family ATPase [Gammaproteobacteria bacterium]
MSVKLKVIGYLVRKETCEEIETALGSISNVVLSMHLQDGEWSLKSVGDEEIPDIIIYEIDGSKEEEIQDLEKILQEFAQRVTVYVTEKNGDIETMRRLMRAGVRDVFPQPIQTHELVNAVTNILSEKRTRLGQSKGGKGGVTSFISAKGGCGATTIAMNVAEILAHTFEAKVLLIDLDVQFGDAALLLDLIPGNNVMDALLQPHRVDPVFLKALITRHGSGLDVLASPADISSMGGISSDGVTSLIDAAVEVYDFVILDVPRVLTSWTMEALRCSDPVMLVGQNNLSSIRDAKLILDKIKQEGIPADNIEVINNRAMSKEGSIDINKLKETLGIERMHKASNDYKASVYSQNQGQPVEEISRGSKFTKDLHALAEYLYVLQKGETKKKGLFDKLFSK